MLGIRLDPATEQALEVLARRTRRSKSDIAREVITRHVREHDENFLDQARRESARVAVAEDAEGWALVEAIEAEDGDWS